MDNDLHTALTEALAEALGPHVAALQTHRAALKARVAPHVARKAITESVKRCHRAVLTALGGRCPCCALAHVLDRDGRVQGAEWDHRLA